jgi:hypothetical protein
MNTPDYMTVLDLAIAMGAKSSLGGSYTMEELNKYGFSIMGGCARCEAIIACYNAYPTHSGYWKCEDCLDNDGFTSLKDFNLFQQSRK